MAENPKDLAEYQSDHDILIDLKRIVIDMRADFKEAKGSYVTQAEFWPVKVLVYGCTGLMLTAVIGALLVLVLK
jgi:hypothetical protein